MALDGSDFVSGSCSACVLFCRLFMIAQQRCNLVWYMVYSQACNSLEMAWNIFVMHYCCGVFVSNKSFTYKTEYFYLACFSFNLFELVLVILVFHQTFSILVSCQVYLQFYFCLIMARNIFVMHSWFLFLINVFEFLAKIIVIK